MSSDPLKPTLGVFLREKREALGVSLEQISAETRINFKVLLALENDRYADLPAKPFVRGFVTSYCRTLGLAPREVLLQFQEFIEERTQHRADHDQELSGYAFDRKDGDQSRVWLSWILGSFLVVGGVGYVLFKPSLHHRKKSARERLIVNAIEASPSPLASAVAVVHSPVPAHSPVVKTVVVHSPAPVAVVVVAPSPSPVVPVHKESPHVALHVPSPVPSHSEKPDPLNSGVGLNLADLKHKWICKALEDTWVRYKVDDRPMMKIILRKDRVLVLRALHSIRLQASHPENLIVNQNGVGAKPLRSARGLKAYPSGADTLLVRPAGTTEEDPFVGENKLPTSIPQSPKAAAEPAPVAPAGE